MRSLFPLLLCFFPSIGFAQTKEIDDAVKQKLATAKFLTSLQAPNGGFYPAPIDRRNDVKYLPSLRATNAAVRSLKYLGVDVPNKHKHAAFVLKCFDSKTGGFADVPEGKTDAALTSIGVMAAVELDVPKEKYAKAMDYLKERAKTFEEVRIGAAAIEAWGVKDCPFKLDDWVKIATDYASSKAPADLTEQNGLAREAGSLGAFFLRLDKPLPPNDLPNVLRDGQRPDGGWGKRGEKASDPETTYRVMRAMMLLKIKPKDVKKLREFVESHRNSDGGYAMKAGDSSTVSGVYYAVVVLKWLNAMEKE